MFGGTENFMTMRCVRNKLRKRDETPSPIIQEKAARLDMNFDRTLANYNCTCQHEQIPNAWDASSNDNIARGFSLEKNMFVEHKHVSFVRTSGIQMANVIIPSDINPINTKWVFPPKAPTPNICNCLDDETLDIIEGKPSLKGLRKQFSGRFKRFVAKKPETNSTIPSGLKPQLKTIYVY